MLTWHERPWAPRRTGKQTLFKVIGTVKRNSTLNTAQTAGDSDL
jgi:hypothetical protein